MNRLNPAVVVIALSVVACSSEPESPIPAETGGAPDAGADASKGGAAGETAGSGGSAGTSHGGSGGKAEQGGSAGASGSGGKAGADAGVGGAGGNTGGSAGNGGTSGTGGSAGEAGAGGEAGAAGDGGSAGDAGSDAGTGGTAGSMGGSAGSGGVCVPGSTQPCYSGPDGTQGMGVCKAGLRTCDSLGTSYGPCVGEVLPQPENCATSADDDCNGMSPVCTGYFSWSKRFGNAMNQSVASVTTHPDDSVTLAGSFAGVLDFGAGALTAAGGNDIFIAHFDGAGTHSWSKRFGDAAEQQALAAAVNASGRVFLTGAYAGTVNFGAVAMTAAGSTDAYVAAFSSSGNHVWSKGFGDASTQAGTALAVDPSGNVIMAGKFAGSMDLGGGVLTSSGGTDVFVAKFNENGTHLWSNAVGSTGDDSALAIATDTAGNVVVTGRFRNTVDFGGGALASSGSDDIFLAMYNADGSHQWSKSFGSTGDDAGLGVDTDAAGNVVLTGSFMGNVDFGGGTLFSPAYGGFVAKYSSSGGHVWSKTFASTGGQSYGNGVSIDPLGNVILAGRFSGTVTFGGAPLTSAGSDDAFITKLDPSGGQAFARRYGDASAQSARSVATDSSANMIFTGDLAGTADFGGGPVTSAGLIDVFLVKIQP